MYYLIVLRIDSSFARMSTVSINICGLEASFPGPIAILLLRSRNIIDMHIRMRKCETYVKRPKSETSY